MLTDYLNDYYLILTFAKMPTFKKKKNLRGLFTSQDIKNAVDDVLDNGLGLREAARKYNLCHTTISRYIKRIKNDIIGRSSVSKLSMVTKQVSGYDSFVLFKLSSVT